MKTPRFSGPFKWSALRQQLLSLREDIQSIQKVAGRNVTIDEHRGKGKVINARSDEGSPSGGGGCSGCGLPVGDCPHSVCVQFKLDGDDTSNQDIVEFFADVFGHGWGFFYEDGNWNMYGFNFAEDTTGSLAASDVFDTWHALSVQMRTSGTVVTVQWSVDGVSGTSFDTYWHGTLAGTLRCGAFSGSGDAHRTIRCVTVLANPATDEQDFNFPPGSFDSFVGGAAIVGGQLRIDSTAADVYADKFLSPAYSVECTGACCVGETCTVTSEADCTGIYQGDGTVCDPNPCCLDSRLVSLLGVTFCSDCFFISLDHGFKISDDTLNGTSYTLEGGPLTDPGCTGCGWDSLTLLTQPNIKIHDYYTNGACTGDSTDLDNTPIIVAAVIDDTYYVYAYAGFTGRKLSIFYGSGSGPSSISNTLSDCTSLFDLNDRFTDCVFGDGSPGSGLQSTIVVATGGSATIA